MDGLAEINEEALRAISIAVDERHPISSLEELGVGQRMINLLHSNGINDMGDLMRMDKNRLMRIQNFGQKQLRILFEALAKYHSLPS